MSYYAIFDDTEETSLPETDNICEVEWCEDEKCSSSTYCNRHRVMAQNNDGKITRTAYDDRLEMDKLFGKDTRSIDELVVQGEYRNLDSLWCDRCHKSLSTLEFDMKEWGSYYKHCRRCREVHDGIVPLKKRSNNV